MFETLFGMVKEEWRIHSSLFGNFLFASFPLIILAFSFLLSFYTLNNIITLNKLLLIYHCIFILVGLSVGAFGILGREAMNRRFGHASLIAFSSRTLPLSEKFIFLNFFIKDLIYYFILWILPFVAGAYIAFTIKNVYVNFFVIIASIFMSFLASLSFSFFLSTIYIYSKKLVIAVIFSIILLSKYVFHYIEMLPSISFMLKPSLENLIYSLLISCLLSLTSVNLLKVDYAENKKRYKNMVISLEKFLRFSRYKDFIAKDFIDLNRSEGGLAKLIFSLILPTILIWFILSLNFIPFADFLIVFAIMLGAISSSTYNWITEFDVFSSYSFLPIKVSSIIKSKIATYSIINSLCFIILFIASIKAGLSNLIPSLMAFASVSSYVLAMNIYLTGLHPNILLYNSKILIQYLLLTSPILLILMFSSKSILFYFFVLAVLAIAYLIIKKSLEKWDKEEIVF
ncbi:MAG: hypothetical protein QXM68_02825 [Candidatus Aenigmatarchaeota archaeon]|nr:hypothetical protein [Candidatus Aenigmarchaeota archaeon]